MAGEPAGPGHDPASGPLDRSRAAVALLVEHADRSVAGREVRPAVVGAVVAIEELSVRLATTDPSVLAGAVRAADVGEGPRDVVETLRHHLHTVAVALARDGEGWVADATVLNPETGGHAVTTDLATLRAATRASVRSYREVGYYDDRYAERGARYSLSDSGWLAHLVPAPPEVAARQVVWLADLLAGKGMPTWLMERHLETLVAELEHDGLDTGSLPHAHEHLRSRRRAVLADEELEKAERWTTRNLGASPTSPVGLLVAAAVADTLAGVTLDASALMDWLCDPARTQPHDAAALVALHDHLRAAAGTTDDPAASRS